jgi:hypothetical protein
MIRDDEPTRLGPRSYAGPITSDSLMKWFDDQCVEGERMFETNLLCSVLAGDLDIDDVDDDRAGARPLRGGA